MILKTVRSNARDAAQTLIVLLAAAGLTAYPTQSVEAARDGISLCLSTVIPALFPFLIASSMLVRLGVGECLSRRAAFFMRPLFGIGGAGAAALVTGLISGYPVGARTAAELYRRGECTADECGRLLAFCNNSGPAFILGVLGGGVFGNMRAGALLLAVHISAALAVGLIFRKKSSGVETAAPRESAPRETFTAAFTGSIRSALSAIAGICGCVVLFSVVIGLMQVSGLLPLVSSAVSVLTGGAVSADMARALISGTVEMTSGAALLAGAENTKAAVAAAAFMLGWGGLSVHFQTFSCLEGSGLPAGKYIAGKLLHGAVSALLAFAAVSLFPVKAQLPASVPHAQAPPPVSGPRVSAALIAAALFLLLVCAIKISGKRRKGIV